MNRWIRLTALLFASLLLFLASGCERRVAHTPPPEPPAGPVQPAGPQASQTPFVKVTRHYEGVGVVTKINNELGSVELNHEEIKGLMPPMTMEWFVKEKAMLKGLKVGATVDFTIEDISGSESISAIKPRAEGKK